MLFYHCPDCGAWCDVKLAEAFTNIVNKAAAQLAQPSPVQTPIIYPCPHGHGPMVQVLPTDRIFVRPGVIEASISMELVIASPVQH